MVTKSTFSVSLLVLHVVVLMWYYSQPTDWASLNPQLARIIFNGSQFLIVGSQMLLSATETTKLHFEIIRLHACFVLLFGLVYATHYMGLFTTTSIGLKLFAAMGMGGLFVVLHTAFHGDKDDAI